MKPRKIGGGLLLIPGSPSTLIKPLGGNAVVVDPGYGENRCYVIRNALKQLGLDVEAVILTHGHPDHLAEAGCLDAPIYAHRFELSIVENGLLRETVVYGARLPRTVYSIRAEDLRVSETFEWGEKLYGFETLALPGHSPGHTGLLDREARTIYVGDAFFGDRLMDRVGIPFAPSHEEFLESIEKLRPFVGQGYKFVLSHGPIVDGRRALRLLDHTAGKVREAEKLVVELLGGKPLSLPRLSFEVTRRLSSAEAPGPELLLLNEVTLKSIVSKLVNEGLAEPVVVEGELRWKLSKTS